MNRRVHGAGTGSSGSRVHPGIVRSHRACCQGCRAGARPPWFTGVARWPPFTGVRTLIRPNRSACRRADAGEPLLGTCRTPVNSGRRRPVRTSRRGRSGGSTRGSGPPRDAPGPPGEPAGLDRRRAWPAAISTGCSARVTAEASRTASQPSSIASAASRGRADARVQHHRHAGRARRSAGCCAGCGCPGPEPIGEPERHHRGAPHLLEPARQRPGRRWCTAAP